MIQIKTFVGFDTFLPKMTADDGPQTTPSHEITLVVFCPWSMVKNRIILNTAAPNTQHQFYKRLPTIKNLIWVK
jgi:hypothetical protein